MNIPTYQLLSLSCLNIVFGFDCHKFISLHAFTLNPHAVALLTESLQIHNRASRIDINHPKEVRFCVNRCLCSQDMINLLRISQRISLPMNFFHCLTPNRPFPSQTEMFYARAVTSQRQHSYWFQHKPSPAPCWLIGGMSFNEQDEKRKKRAIIKPWSEIVITVTFY